MAVAATLVVVLCVVGVCALAVFVLVGPALGNRYSPPASRSECPFVTDVIVFEDANGNQFRESSETGIKDVGIRVTANNKSRIIAVTDSAGLAQIDWHNADCVTLVAAELPPGYQATTEITFGPYRSPVRRSSPLYVGLQPAP